MPIFLQPTLGLLGPPRFEPGRGRDTNHYRPPELLKIVRGYAIAQPIMTYCTVVSVVSILSIGGEFWWAGTIVIIGDDYKWWVVMISDSRDERLVMSGDSGD